MFLNFIILLSTYYNLLYNRHWDRYQSLYLQYTVNWSTPMMLMCIKLQSFAWSYYDGHREVDIIRK